MTSIAKSPTSMIIDGIAASEAIDSSGEILDVKGCDVSDFENGVGTLNWEHRGDDANGASGNDTVGKIIYVKKIFKKEDCEDKRQEAYWDSLKLPYIYIKARLFDGAGHAGASAIAAIIRDAVMHKEPILAKFSIEGTTLKKEGQHLRKTCARKVAVTLKPANKSAVSGLISDPNAPKPITAKQSEKSLLDQLFETVKSEVPGHQYLGGHARAYTDMDIQVQTSPSEMVKLTAQNVKKLLKAMEAGQGGGAPSTLTQGAALQREDDRLHQFDKKRFKNDLRAAVRDMPDSAKLSRGAMHEFFKFKLPEANPTFLEHFTDLIDDIRTRQVGDWVEKTMKVWEAVKKTEDRLKKDEPKPEAPKITEPKDYVPSKEANPPTKVPQPPRGGPGMTEKGSILSRKLTQQHQRLKLYPYENDDLYKSVINADEEGGGNLDPALRQEIIKKVHTPWMRAAKNWMALNLLARAGALPSPVVAQSAILAAMSPNTSVPIQEFYYGKYQDFTKKHGDLFLDPQGIDPKDAEAFHDFLNDSTPPEFFKKYYLGNVDEKGGLSFDVAAPARTPGASLAKRPQGLPLLNYHRFHPLMMALHKEVKDDGRAFVDYIMQHKLEHGASAMMHGFGPKLARYMALMMGKGNMVVPDRHFIRALFNLSPDDQRLEYALNILPPAEGERLLRGIDHQYFQRAPTVQKVLKMWPDHFRGNEMQATGLGFWLQWLATPFYNRLRGEKTGNLNEGAAHDPYWKAVHDILTSERIPHEVMDPTSLYKNETQHDSLPARISKATKRVQDQFGENPAAFFHYSYGIPALMMLDRIQGVDQGLIRKMEALSVELTHLYKNEFESTNPNDSGFMQAQPGVVHAKIHVPQHYVINDKQNKLVHGMNISEGTREHPETSATVKSPSHFVAGGTPGGWFKTPEGNLAYVKKSHSIDSEYLPSDPHHEVLYHNLMHHFGLGNYLPTTTLVRHPDADPTINDHTVWRSVHEAVPNARHATSSDRARLNEMWQTGELQKLGLTNSMLGNYDRHGANYLMGGKDQNELYLIDHGHTFSERADWPDYIHKALEHNPYATDRTLHPEAKKWLMGIDEEKLKKVLEEHNAPMSLQHGVLSKLQAMKDYLGKEPDATFHEVFDSKYGNHYWDRGAAWRAAKDPEFAKRYVQMSQEYQDKRGDRQAHIADRGEVNRQILNEYVKNAIKGEGETDPWKILERYAGSPENAVKLIKPFSGPFNEEEIKNKFNFWVKHNAGWMLGQATRFRDDLARDLANFQAGKAYDPLAPKPGASDTMQKYRRLLESLHAPPPVSNNPEEVRDQIETFLAEEIKKHRRKIDAQGVGIR